MIDFFSIREYLFTVLSELFSLLSACMFEAAYTHRPDISRPDTK